MNDSKKWDAYLSLSPLTHRFNDLKIVLPFFFNLGIQRIHIHLINLVLIPFWPFILTLVHLR